ncbi:MAG TPA: hypothetical protein VF483_10665 [Gemmatimonadaceae bacterium]
MARRRSNRPGKPGGPKKRGGPRRGRARGKAPARKAAPSLYVQPGKRGTVVVLHRAVGNRATPKVCGVMPTREHADALMNQLLRAEGALMDLFYEATDDGIEALEAVLLATWNSVLERTPGPEGTPTREELSSERDRIQHELDSVRRAPR